MSARLGSRKALAAEMAVAASFWSGFVGKWPLYKDFLSVKRGRAGWRRVRATAARLACLIALRVGDECSAASVLYSWCFARVWRSGQPRALGAAYGTESLRSSSVATADFAHWSPR